MIKWTFNDIVNIAQDGYAREGIIMEVICNNHKEDDFMKLIDDNMTEAEIHDLLYTIACNNYSQIVKEVMKG